MTNYKDKIILVIILISILYIYSISLYPAFANNDSPEIMTAAKTLGICHPPGYPFFYAAWKDIFAWKNWNCCN